MCVCVCVCACVCACVFVHVVLCVCRHQNGCREARGCCLRYTCYLASCGEFAHHLLLGIGYVAPNQGVTQQKATRLVALLAARLPTSSPHDQLHAPLSVVGVVIYGLARPMR